MGNFSVFVSPYFSFFSSSSEYYDIYYNVVREERGGNILSTYFGISYLSDSMINFELGWSPTINNELYFSVGYVL